MLPTSWDDRYNNNLDQTEGDKICERERQAPQPCFFRNDRCFQVNGFAKPDGLELFGLSIFENGLWMLIGFVTQGNEGTFVSLASLVLLRVTFLE
mmetsp:Transcript_26541/g.32558  ORF Transcript_26541/g.32558 Transcript_26541/m.32558 type:complete len:95 (+) Transcript_26541:428-712(+)